MPRHSCHAFIGLLVTTAIGTVACEPNSTRRLSAGNACGEFSGYALGFFKVTPSGWLDLTGDGDPRLKLPERPYFRIAPHVAVVTEPGRSPLLGGKAVVWRKPKGSGALEPVTVPLDVKSGGARGLLLVDSDLYFVREPPVVNQALDRSALQRISKTANAGTPLEMGGANQSNLVTDGTYVYYANGNDLLRLPK
jgi:hypothetical protein